MIGFLIGLFVGGALGVVTMCIVSVSGHNDHDDDSFIQDTESRDKEE